MAIWTVALIDPTGVDWSNPIAAKAAATTLYEALVETRTAIEAQNALMASLAETPVQKAVRALNPIAAKAAATTLYEALVETRTAIEAQNALMASLAETPVQKAVRALNALYDLPVATGPAAYADALKPFNLTPGELDTAVSTSKVPTGELGAILAALGITSVGPVGPSGPTRF